MKQSKRNLVLGRAAGWVSAVLVLATGGTAEAQQAVPATQPAAASPTTLVSAGTNPDGRMTLKVGRSVVLSTRVPVSRLSVANPEVADVNPVGPRSVLVTGKKPGQTQVMVWDDAEHSQTIDVDVQSDLKQLDAQLKSLIPGAAIETSNANGIVVLKGRVPNLQASDQAAQLAAPYGTKVLNFLEVAGGQQVMLQVRFAEVSRTATSSLGVNFGFTDGKAIGISNIGQVSPLGVTGTPPVLGVPSPSPNVTVFGRGQVGSTTLDVLVQALRENNLLRILAEPNLVAISGQEASFLAGGEFPVPVPQGGAGTGGAVAITIDYREFGVRLNFVPVVLGDGRIRLKVSPEVSDLDFSAGVVNQGFRIPIINKRRVDTTIELNEGQTFAIAGLLNHSVNADTATTPGLGDLPVLGTLFRSVRYQRQETELLVLVTPKLVEGMNPDQVPAVPGEKWRHPTESQLFWDKDMGGPESRATTRPSAGATATAAAAPTQPPPAYEGDYGFQPAASSVASSNE